MTYETHSLAEKDGPGRVGVVVEQVEENDELREAICQDRPERHAGQVAVLFAPVGHVRRKGKELEQHVENRDEDGRAEEPRVGLKRIDQKGFDSQLLRWAKGWTKEPKPLPQSTSS